MVTDNLSFLILRSRETLGDGTFRAHFSNDLHLQYYGVEIYQEIDGCLEFLGLCIAGVVCSDVVVYNALTNKWSKAANMTTARSWFAAAVVGTKVYVAGGQGNTKFLDTAEVYDSETDQWEPIASMGNRRSSCYGVCLDGQFWVVAGEYVKNHYDNNQRSSAEVYDAETDTWCFIPNMCIDDNKVRTQPASLRLKSSNSTS